MPLQDIFLCWPVYYGASHHRLTDISPSVRATASSASIDPCQICLESVIIVVILMIRLLMLLQCMFEESSLALSSRPKMAFLLSLI